MLKDTTSVLLVAHLTRCSASLCSTVDFFVAFYDFLQNSTYVQCLNSVRFARSMSLLENFPSRIRGGWEWFLLFFLVRFALLSHLFSTAWRSQSVIRRSTRQAQLTSVPFFCCDRQRVCLRTADAWVRSVPDSWAATFWLRRDTATSPNEPMGGSHACFPF